MAVVTVSENEVEVAVAKALAGLAVPAGLDREAGKIAAMALTSGLDDGSLVFDGISRTAARGHESPAVVREEPGLTRLDAGARSTLTLGLPVLEFAFTLALAESDGTPAAVDVENLGEPLLLAGALCRLARVGRPAVAAWASPEGTLTCLGASADACDGARWQAGHGPDDLRPEPGCVRLRAAAGSSPAQLWPAFEAAPHDRLADWLAARRQRLTQGVTVPHGLWQKLKAYGQLTLVPETSTEARRG